MKPPLISSSVMTSSTTYTRIRETGRFAVNVLSHRQVDISSQFARKGTEKWAGINWSPATSGNPIIQDTLIWLDCDIWAEHQAGDHLIVIGEVTEMSPVEWHRHDPLLFFRGAYRFLRDSIG